MVTMSATRKRYVARLVVRILIFIICLILCFTHPKAFEILEGANFFAGFSIFHFLWGIWVFDMILQIVPIKNKVALGSQKLFANRFRPIRDGINYETFKKYLIKTTKAAYKVFILWGILIAGIGSLYYQNVIDELGLFMMFSPLIFVGGFFSISLVVLALLAWFVWELCILIYPERFCEMTNAALKFSECTDKLCTQYCQKLRPKNKQM